MRLTGEHRETGSGLAFCLSEVIQGHSSKAKGPRAALGTDHDFLKIKTTDSLKGETHFLYDTLGRLITQTNALGGVHSFTYDPVGNKLTETDEEKRLTKWEYDGENRVTKIANALNDVKTITYDERKRGQV
jgi:YD repeat-containing protein